jgi:hypothetical protein
MKRVIESNEKAGLELLLGERVTLLCMNYFYTGKLTGVNAVFVELTDPAIVYETGPFNEPSWKDAQKLSQATWNVMIQAIESFGVMK